MSAMATATATRRPWSCAMTIVSAAVACGVGAVVGGLARFDAPRAREWVIARDEATMRADASGGGGGANVGRVRVRVRVASE